LLNLAGGPRLRTFSAFRARGGLAEVWTYLYDTASPQRHRVQESETSNCLARVHEEIDAQSDICRNRKSE
jgi:hypothetical protein